MNLAKMPPPPSSSGPNTPHPTGPLGTVARLVPFLGPQVVHRFLQGKAWDRPLSVPVIFDPEDPITNTPGGLLLFTGKAERAFDEEFLEALQQAGFSGIAVKARPAALELAPTLPPIGVLFIDEEVSWRQLFALVSAASHQSANDSEPERAQQSLFSISNSLAAALGGATAIEDRERNVLAYSTVFGHTVDSLRRDGILARQVPDLPKHNKQYREVYAATRPVAFAFDSSDGELPRTAIAIRSGQEILGSIWVILENDSPADRTESVLSDAATLAAIQLLRHRSALDIETHMREEWLRATLAGQPADSWSDSRFGVTPETPVALFAIRVEDDQSESSPHPSEIKLAAVNAAKIHGLTASATVVQNRCYLLGIDLQSQESAQRAAETVGRALTKRFGCRLSIAYGLFSWQDVSFNRVSVELDDALAALGPHPEECRILFINQIRSELLLLAISRHLPSYHRLAHPALAEMRKSDLSSGSEHERTLLAYLSALGDVPAAAASLHIHPNTLRYRLKRLAELFAIDLGDSHTALALWLQMWAHRSQSSSTR